MSDKRYSKVEEEVLEILDRLEHEAPSPPRSNLRLVSSKSRRRRPWEGLGARIRSRTPRIPGVWVAIAIIVGLFALMRVDVPGIVSLVLIFGIIGFFLWGMLRGGPPQSSGGFGGPGMKTWRGRDIHFGPAPGPPPAERIARLFRRSGRPRR